MTKISASASMGVKLKIFSDFENVNPHVSITVEDEVADALTSEEKVQEAIKLYKLCREYVQKEIEIDIASAKSGKEGKHIGKKVR